MSFKSTAHPVLISGKEFLEFPSPSRLQQLGPDCIQSIRNALGSEISDVDRVIGTLMKVCLVVDEKDEKSFGCACDIADGLLNEVFVETEEADSVVANSFLVYLGLIKGEDKKYKAPNNITGPLLVLNHIVKQSYFPRSARETFSYFFSKPHPQLDTASSARHKILQTLYSF